MNVTVETEAFETTRPFVEDVCDAAENDSLSLRCYGKTFTPTWIELEERESIHYRDVPQDYDDPDVGYYVELMGGVMWHDDMPIQVEHHVPDGWKLSFTTDPSTLDFSDDIIGSKETVVISGYDHNWESEFHPEEMWNSLDFSDVEITIEGMALPFEQRSQFEWGDNDG